MYAKLLQLINIFNAYSYVQEDKMGPAHFVESDFVESGFVESGFVESDFVERRFRRIRFRRMQISSNADFVE